MDFVIIPKADSAQKEDAIKLVEKLSDTEKY
jgi:hypothetical protein